MELTDKALETLYALATEATPGPWYLGEPNKWQLYEGRFVRTSSDKSGTCLVVTGGRNGDFIAAANPSAIKALIEEVCRLRAIHPPSDPGHL